MTTQGDKILAIISDNIRYAVGDELITKRGLKGKITNIIICFTPGLLDINVQAKFENGEEKNFIQCNAKDYFQIGEQNLISPDDVEEAKRRYEQVKAVYEFCLERTRTISQIAEDGEQS